MKNERLNTWVKLPPQIKIKGETKRKHKKENKQGKNQNKEPKMYQICKSKILF